MSKSRIHHLDKEANRFLRNAIATFGLTVGATVAYTLFFARELGSLLNVLSY